MRNKPHTFTWMYKITNYFLPFLGEHAGDGAEVWGAEGAPLEAADEEAAGELGADGADPRPGLGCGPPAQRGHRQGRHHGGPGRDGPRGVPQAGQFVSSILMCRLILKLSILDVCFIMTLFKFKQYNIHRVRPRPSSRSRQMPGQDSEHEQNEGDI